MVTWNVVKVNLNDESDRVSVTIIDDVKVKEYTSDAFARDLTNVKDKIAASLKEKINADRAKEVKESTVGSNIDLTNFETYLNT